MTASRRPWLVPVCERRTLVVGEAGEGIDHCGEVGWCRPRGPGVLGLVEERRHPRDEEQAAERDGDQRGPRCRLGAPVPAPAHDGHDQPDGRPCRRDRSTSTACRARPRPRRDRDEIAGTRRRHRPVAGREAAAGQQDDQRVHPRLGRVVHGEGCAGQQDEHRPGDSPAAEAPPAEPGDREGDHREDAREGAHGIVGLPEEHDPEVEEVVVQRRGAVVLERARDLRGAAGGRCRP